MSACPFGECPDLRRFVSRSHPQQCAKCENYVPAVVVPEDTQ